MVCHIWCYFLEVFQRVVLKIKALGFGHSIGSEAKIWLIPYSLDSIGTALSCYSGQITEIKPMSQVFNCRW